MASYLGGKLNRPCGVSLFRDWSGTYVAACDRARLDEVLDADNTASDVWADAVYPSAMLEAQGLVSRIHREMVPQAPDAASAPVKLQCQCKSWAMSTSLCLILDCM